MSEYGSIVVSKVVEYLVYALKVQASYLCCYSCNVARLADEIRELNLTYESVLEGGLTPVVSSWLGEVEEVQRKSDRIRNAAEEVGRNCLCKWYPVLHYSLSRDALNTTEAAIHLRRNVPPFPVSIPRRPVEMNPIPNALEIWIKSRDYIEEQIMNALNDEKVYLIGLCGMGGVGKTTMAKKIEKRVREQKSMFEHVGMAIISQQPNLRKIQNQIAEGLGLKLGEESLIYRARKLHERLMVENGVLIILDDVWERLNLEELGIPSQITHPGCKLILTSRNGHALTLTSHPVSNIFQLEVLNNEESWILLRETIGSGFVPDFEYRIAMDIARECEGLPIALKTVGCALRNSGKSSWRNTLHELRNFKEMNFQGIVNEIHKPLVFSINQLQSEEARYLFLLCCLLPEDDVISPELLVRWGIGLGIFEGFENLLVVRNKVETILKILISRSLLLIESNKKWDNEWGIQLYVKMHDVIREVGILISSMNNIESKGKIAFKEKHVFMIRDGIEEWPKIEEEYFRNYTLISLLFSRQEVVIPEFMDFPKLEFLQIGLIESLRGIYLNIPENFFSGMRRIRVLEASNGSLPLSVGLLNNLQTLHLSQFVMFGRASVIGKLINLEILRLEYCGVDVLPIDIGELRKLRQLVISNCRNLRVAFGIISRLVQLEELVIFDSFDDWEAEGEENNNGITNARLSELDCLNHLTTLRIQIGNPSVLPIQMPHWAQKLNKYSIVVSRLAGKDRRFPKGITLGSEVVFPLGDWFYDLASDAEYLNLEGSSCSMVLKQLARYSRKRNCGLKYLSLSEFSNVQYLFGGQQKDAIFPMLKYLCIENSPSLKQICRVPPSAGSFVALEEINLKRLPQFTCLWKFTTEELYLSNLKSVVVADCENFAYLFSLSTAQSLSRLEELMVSDCPNMKEIFRKDGEMGIERIKFRKLHSLRLLSMKSLCCVCKGVDGIEFPDLRCLELGDLPNIIGIGRPSIHPRQRCLFQQQVYCPKLKSLWLSRLPNIARIFPLSTFRGLIKLEKLVLEDCEELQEVIANEEVEEQTNIKEVLSPHLNEFWLLRLPKIQRFCHIKHSLEFPSLQTVRIMDCPMLERLFLGALHLPNLTRIDGLPNPDFAAHVFFNKEISTRPIHPENNCFTISAREISISGFPHDPTLYWFLAPDSSESFVDAVELNDVTSVKIEGNFETIKLAVGVEYEITFLIMLDKNVYMWEELIELQLYIPRGGITQKRAQILKELPRGKWIEISLGKFTIESHNQGGQLYFGLYQRFEPSENPRLSIKGVIIMKA